MAVGVAVAIGVGSAVGVSGGKGVAVSAEPVAVTPVVGEATSGVSVVAVHEISRAPTIPAIKNGGRTANGPLAGDPRLLEASWTLSPRETAGDQSRASQATPIGRTVLVLPSAMLIAAEENLSSNSTAWRRRCLPCFCRVGSPSRLGLDCGPGRQVTTALVPFGFPTLLPLLPCSSLMYSPASYGAHVPSHHRSGMGDVLHKLGPWPPPQPQAGYGDFRPVFGCNRPTYRRPRVTKVVTWGGPLGLLVRGCPPMLEPLFHHRIA